MLRRFFPVLVVLFLGCSNCPEKNGHCNVGQVSEDVGVVDQGGDAFDSADMEAESDPGNQGMECTDPLKPSGIVPISVEGKNLVDDQGRIVILHGVNISGMEWGKKHVFTQDDLHGIAKAGFNAVRFPIGWTGIEPKEGKIDQEYLDAVKQVVDWAAAEGLYVMIDMHQWFWCQVGMPRWTCLQDPKLDPEQEMAESKHFFESRTLQSTLAKRWGMVAGMFRDYDNVIGYDLFNEPVPITVDSLLNGSFDRDYLAPFYDLVIKEIRKHDKRHLLVLEPNVGSFTSKTSLSRPKDPLIAFSPHYYCPHSPSDHGTVWLIPPSPDLLRTQYLEGARVQSLWDCPVLVGEFGAPQDEDKMPEWLDTSVTWQESLGFSFFYWAYTGGWGVYDTSKKSMKPFYMRHIIRSFPVAVAGRDLHFSSRPWSGWLDMSYTVDRADLCRVTEVYIPTQMFNHGPDISVKGASDWRFDKASRHLLIMANKPGEVSVKVR